MIKFIIFLMFAAAALISNDISGCSLNCTQSSQWLINPSDTITDKQDFYNGKIWNNNFLNIENDQFLFSRDFNKASVSMRGKTYDNVLIRYDIFNDEIITFSGTGSLLQLNKEMVDSFSINYQGKTYRFIKLQENPESEREVFFNVLYEGSNTLCIKHIKEIHYSTSEGSENRFVEKDLLYLFRDGNAYLITKKSELFKVLKVEKSKIRQLSSGNKTAISLRDPESLVPLLRSLEESNK